MVATLFGMRLSPLQNCGLIAFAAIALFSAGCVSPAKTFHAPDFQKVDAASKRLGDAHRNAAATTERAEVNLAAAQKNADALADHSASAINLIDELAGLVPLELQPRFAELRTAVQSGQADAGDLVTNLAGAQKEIGHLKQKDLPEAAKAKAESDAAVAEVKKEAKKTAEVATNESARRYKAESQLVQNKILRWLWRIGGGFVVLGFIALIVLWCLGKISIKGARAYFHI